MCVCVVSQPVHFSREKVHSFQSIILKGVCDPKKATSHCSEYNNLLFFFFKFFTVNKDRKSLHVCKYVYNTKQWICLRRPSSLILRECVFHYCEINQAKGSKAQEASLFSQALEGTGAGEVIRLLFYSLPVTARKNGLKPSSGSQRKKSRTKLDSLEQEEVVRSPFVPPQIGSAH